MAIATVMILAQEICMDFVTVNELPEIVDERGALDRLGAVGDVDKQASDKTRMNELFV
jgi:hypothetical protein